MGIHACWVRKGQHAKEKWEDLRIRFFDEVFTSLVKLGAARRWVEYGELMDILRCERGELDSPLQEWCGLKIFGREGGGFLWEPHRRRIRFSAAMAAIPDHW